MLARLSAGLALAFLCAGVSSPAAVQRPLLPHPTVLAGASVGLLDRLRGGAKQLGRWRHDILVVAPASLVPAIANRADRWVDWWVASWEPAYQEVRLSDLRSSNDVGDIAFDAGLQLGAGKIPAIRRQELAWNTKFEQRLRTETSSIVEELFAGWRELAGRR